MAPLNLGLPAHHTSEQACTSKRNAEPTWQYIFISVLLDILLPLSYVGGVDLLRPVFGR